MDGYLDEEYDNKSGNKTELSSSSNNKSKSPNKNLESNSSKATVDTISNNNTNTTYISPDYSLNPKSTSFEENKDERKISNKRKELLSVKSKSKFDFVVANLTSENSCPECSIPDYIYDIIYKRITRRLFLEKIIKSKSDEYTLFEKEIDSGNSSWSDFIKKYSS